MNLPDDITGYVIPAYLPPRELLQMGLASRGVFPRLQQLGLAQNNIINRQLPVGTVWSTSISNPYYSLNQKLELMSDLNLVAHQPTTNFTIRYNRTMTVQQETTVSEVVVSYYVDKGILLSASTTPIDVSAEEETGHQWPETFNFQTIEDGDQTNFYHTTDGQAYNLTLPLINYVPLGLAWSYQDQVHLVRAGVYYEVPFLIKDYDLVADEAEYDDSAFGSLRTYSEAAITILDETFYQLFDWQQVGDYLDLVVKPEYADLNRFIPLPAIHSYPLLTYMASDLLRQQVKLSWANPGLSSVINSYYQRYS